VNIRYAGRSAFVIRAAGKTLITDPFGEGYGHALIKDAADLVTVSHGHNDHNAVDCVPGKPQVLDAAGHYDLGEIDLTAFPSWHDPQAGALRGPNLIFRLKAENISVVHCGDLGETLPAATETLLGAIDVLLIPVGGVYTIDGAEAATLVARLQPKIVVPMHYRTEAVSAGSELESLEGFTQYFDEIIYTPDLELTRSGLDKMTEQRVCVLDYR
jgi:L-ascorbate metabolism protein UlaG (beta-lactamase superfamily)